MLQHYTVDPTLPLPLPNSLKKWTDYELKETHKHTKRRDLKELIEQEMRDRHNLLVKKTT
jgi:hypothetical protein